MSEYLQSAIIGIGVLSIIIIVLYTVRELLAHARKIAKTLTNLERQLQKEEDRNTRDHKKLTDCFHHLKEKVKRLTKDINGSEAEYAHMKEKVNESLHQMHLMISDITDQTTDFAKRTSEIEDDKNATDQTTIPAKKITTVPDEKDVADAVGEFSAE